ncbi:hypothetical protein E3Q10_00147 [Wallemia mellicola]|uniref:Uncharacterized protein n=1 Tax=Wallemia mellicola TaxID=1708541 RepID=A0A4T0RB31_9BASI|nr:hypothetical protein E3Q19_00121 [Wallemia mellicola]TIC34694.1 hypothetical protein E3Q10_00147 [Wallemia mellicola]TIC76233.1 hypothetical protein E3Q00_00120 [Wallemia mellicola]
MQFKLTKKVVKRQATLPEGFEGSGLKMAGSSSSSNSDTTDNEKSPDSSGIQFDEDADDVINLPQDPPKSDQPQIDQHQHGNENHNEYSSALAPSLTIGIVSVLIIAAVAIRYIKRKKRIEALGSDPKKDNEKCINTPSDANSLIKDREFGTPPPVYTILPRSSSLNMTKSSNSYGDMFHSVNTMHDLPPTPGPADYEDEQMEGLEPPRRPYVQTPPISPIAPIMPRSSSLGTVSADNHMPRSSSIGSVRSIGERVPSPIERVESPFSRASSRASHASLPMPSVTPIQLIKSPNQVTTSSSNHLMTSPVSDPTQSIVTEQSPPAYVPSAPPSGGG